MGLGGRGRPGERATGQSAEESEGVAAAAAAAAGGQAPAKAGWGDMVSGILGSGANPQRKEEQARKKSVALEEALADDKKIRFTIGGVGQRMTKEDFIREVQKLDSRTRKEVVDQSTASQTLKTLAKQDPPIGSISPLKIPQIIDDSDSTRAGGSSDVTAGKRSESISPGRPGQASTARVTKADEEGETAVERKRRLAVLSSQGDEDNGETPAERRRRQAALGMGGDGAEGDEDSDDEGGDRVPPTRRGIRFAEPERGRK